MPQNTLSQLAVCESLLQEHRQMETLLEDLTQALNNLNPETPNALEKAQEIMSRIKHELNTHFACEEEALFPGVSPYHPMVLMEVEHEELIALRDDLLTRLQHPSPTKAERSKIQTLGTTFINEMLDHIGREDAGIFPTCERALSNHEKETIMEKMDYIRAQAQITPTPSITRPERSFRVIEADLDSSPQRPIVSTHLLKPTQLETEDKLEVKHLIIQAGKALSPHWSPKQITLICLKGNGLFTANDQEIELKAGVSIIMTPQLRHAIHAQSDCHVVLWLR